MAPNPYFQQLDAKLGSAIDVSQVLGIVFAPHDQAAGSYAVSKFVVVK